MLRKDSATAFASLTNHFVRQSCDSMGTLSTMRRASLIVLPLLFAAPIVHASPESPSTMSAPIVYPETKRVDVVDETFGQKVADPYRWLENDVRNDKEVAAWVEAQNKVTDAYLASLPGRDVFRNRIKQLYDYERFGVPMHKGSRYFYSHNTGLQNQSVLYTMKTLADTPRLLLDEPETFSAEANQVLKTLYERMKKEDREFYPAIEAALVAVAA